MLLKGLRQMENTVTRISETAGLAPGTPVPVGIDESAPSKFLVNIISSEGIKSDRFGTLPDELPELLAGETMWIDVQGYAGLLSIKKIFDFLEIHPLFQEDILNTRQRSKYEILDDALLITMKRLFYATNGRIHQEQVVFLMKGNCLVTFQTATSDSFDGFRKRMITLKGSKILPGYVIYALLDNLVDNYFEVIERLQASLEKTEKRLLANDMALERGVLSGLKHDITAARHAIWPMKNIMTKLSDDKVDFFPEGIDPYFEDLKDHIYQLDEACEIASDNANSIIQLNMDNLNIHTNEIMKTLALISTVFLPLTFIAGVYGMNFKFMPELSSPWGYPLVLVIMAMIALLLYRTFRTRHWM